MHEDYHSTIPFRDDQLVISRSFSGGTDRRFKSDGIDIETPFGPMTAILRCDPWPKPRVALLAYADSGRHQESDQPLAVDGRNIAVEAIWRFHPDGVGVLSSTEVKFDDPKNPIVGAKRERINEMIEPAVREAMEQLVAELKPILPFFYATVVELEIRYDQNSAAEVMRNAKARQSEADERKKYYETYIYETGLGQEANGVVIAEGDRPEITGPKL